MRSQTFHCGPVMATVRTRNRRTGIVEARYNTALRAAYPEIAAYELAQLAVPMPNLPIDRKGEFERPLTPVEQQALEKYNGHTALARTQHELGAAYASAMASVTPLLARLMTIGGAAFHVDQDGCLPDADVVAAFKDYLDADDEDADGFWPTLARTIQKLDAPITPVQERPPETLTAEERDSPLPLLLEAAISAS